MEGRKSPERESGMCSHQLPPSCCRNNPGRHRDQSKLCLTNILVSCFVQPSRRVSRSGRYSIVTSKTQSPPRPPLLPPPRQTCTTAAHLFIPPGPLDNFTVFGFVLFYFCGSGICLHVNSSVVVVSPVQPVHIVLH